MPIKDFVCEACDHTWDDLVRLTSTAPNCPLCGSAFTRSIITTGPSIMGHARNKIHNRAMRGGSTPSVSSVVPRSYKKKKECT